MLALPGMTSHSAGVYNYGTLDMNSASCLDRNGHELPHCCAGAVRDTVDNRLQYLADTLDSLSPTGRSSAGRAASRTRRAGDASHAAENVPAPLHSSVRRLSCSLLALEASYVCLRCALAELLLCLVLRHQLPAVMH